MLKKFYKIIVPVILCLIMLPSMVQAAQTPSWGGDWVNVNGKLLPVPAYGSLDGNNIEFEMKQSAGADTPADPSDDIFYLEATARYANAITHLYTDIGFDNEVVELVSPSGVPVSGSGFDAYQLPTQQNFTGLSGRDQGADIMAAAGWAKYELYDGNLDYGLNMAAKFLNTEGNGFTIALGVRNNVNGGTRQFNPPSAVSQLENNELVCPEAGLALGKVYFKVKNGKTLTPNTFYKDSQLAVGRHMWAVNTVPVGHEDYQINPTGGDFASFWGNPLSGSYTSHIGTVVLYAAPVYINLSSFVDISTTDTEVLLDVSTRIYSHDEVGPTAVVAPGKIGVGEITVKAFSLDGVTFTSLPMPADQPVGSYYISVDVAKGENYAAATDLVLATQFSITPATINPTISGFSKTYDGTLAFGNTTGKFEVETGILNEKIQISLTDGEYTGANVGNGIEIIDFEVSKDDSIETAGLADNYNLAIENMQAFGNITPATLQVTASPATKTFGEVETGFYTALSDFAVSGFVPGEDTSYITGKPVATILPILDDPKTRAVGDYDVSVASGTLNAQNYQFNITPAEGAFSVTPYDEAQFDVETEVDVPTNVTYNGANQTVAGYTIEVDGILLVEDVDFILSANKTSKLADTYTIEISGIGNYDGALGSFEWVIEQKTIKESEVVSATLVVRDYDGTTDADINNIGTINTIASNLSAASDGKAIVGDDVILTGGTGAYDSATALTTTGAITGATITGADSANYDFKGNAIDATGLINKKTLTVRANPSSKTYGDGDPSYAKTDFTVLTAFENGEDEDEITGNFGVAFENTNGKTDVYRDAGTYDVDATLGTASATNYDFDFVTNAKALTVNKKLVTVSPKPVTKVYSEPDPDYNTLAEFLYSNTFANGEDESVISGSFAADIEENNLTYRPVGDYEVEALAGNATATNYRFEFAAAAKVYEVLKKPLAIKPNSLSISYGVIPTLTADYEWFATGENKDNASKTGTQTFVVSQGNVIFDHEDVLPAGTYSITVSGEDYANYEEDYSTVGTLTVGSVAAVVDPADAPVANVLEYTGSSQELVEAGFTADGDIYYLAVAKDAAAPIAADFVSTNIPEETNAGEYDVYYYVDPDANHTPSIVYGPIPVEITAKEVVITPLAGLSSTYGDSDESYTGRYDLFDVVGIVDGNDNGISYSANIASFVGTHRPVATYNVTSTTTIASTNYYVTNETANVYAVTPRTIDVTPIAGLGNTYGEADESYTGRADLFTVANIAEGETQSGIGVSLKADIAGFVGTHRPVATYDVTSTSTVSSPNYDISNKTANVYEVTPRELTVKPASKPAITYVGSGSLYVIAGLVIGLTVNFLGVTS
ncbi:MBG domain-containing protein [Treponema sp. R6D11]